MINVLIINPEEVLFEGKANKIILPGEQGVFEVLPFHKPLLTRLFSGTITVDDDKEFHVKRGIVKGEEEKVIVIVESS